MIQGVNTVLSYRHRQLLRSSIKRAFRWEFWPLWLFYIPVVFYIVSLVLRFRGLSFTAVNPGLPGSGFIGENKSLTLCQLQDNNPETVAKTLLVKQSSDVQQQLVICKDFMDEQGLDFPVVAKPDFGQRGIDVAIIEDSNQLEAYLQKAEYDTVFQEYIPGVEFGVFYIRYPHEEQGRIFSITHKCFPSIEGDGVSNIEQLIFQHPRLHYMAAFLLKQHKEILLSVPEKGETVDVVKLGSHCRGSLFLDGEQFFSQDLLRAVEQASQHLEGFYFGRYDIRATDIDAFQRGDIRIIEVNGVTSESTNIYDPKNSVFTAYKVLFKQWYLAFDIGKKNIVSGYPAMGISDLIAKVRVMNHGA